MILKKRGYFIALFLMFFSFNIFCADGHSGVLMGERDIKIVQTKWFDIIYPLECSKTASILFEKADSVYEEVAQEYGVEATIRMPVVITPALEVYNAYWTDGPYNHIVFFDTAMIEDLEVFSDTVISTFKHEITHAITYNLRSDFVKALDKFFGDGFSLSFWITSRGMGEGAAVAMESKDGEGRLNDEFAMHQVKQSKIEGKIPSYLDVQSIVDYYPSGLCYYFNGAFNSWLIEKYGMEKYSALWYRCLNMISLTLDGAYKKIYEKDQNELWQEFFQDFSVPSIPGDAVEAGYAKHVVGEKNNSTGRIFSSLTTNDNRYLAYVDESTSSVYLLLWPEVYFNMDELGKKLFTLKNIQNIKFSRDGRFLVVDYININHSAQKRQIKIYDLWNKSFFDLDETGVQDGCIFQDEDKNYYLACQTFHSQEYGINFYSINFKDKNKSKKIENLELINSIKFEYGIVPSNFTPAGDSQIAFLLKEGLNTFIQIYDYFGRCDYSVKAPSSCTALRYLSSAYDDDNNLALYFSWTQKDSLPRYGFLDVNNNTYVLNQTDVSGGVFYPVADLFSEKASLVYVSKMFRQNKLLKAEKKLTENNVTEKAVRSSPKAKASISQQSLNKLTDASSDYKNSLSFYKKGILIPFTDLSSTSYISGTPNYSLPFGLSYSTSNPWDANLIQLDAGYGPETKSGALALTYSSGTDTSLFKYSAQAYVEFDADGFKQTRLDAEIISAVNVGNISSLVFQLSVNNYFGHSEFASVEVKNDLFVNSDIAAVTYSNVHKTGPGRYQKGGFSFTPLIKYSFMDTSRIAGYPKESQTNIDLGFKGTVYIPNLLPFDCRKDFVYNLPLKVSFNLFNETNSSAVSQLWGINIGVNKVSDLIGFNAASFEAETILFSYEIQKGIPVINFLYAGDVRLSLIYGGGFNYDPANRFDNWHFLHFNEYLEKIKNNQIEYKDFFAVNLSIGISTIFGNPSSMVWSFKLIPDFREKTVKFGFSYDASF